jgi:hypothetical protein
VHGLEIDPVRDCALEVDQDILRHRIAVSEPASMKVGKRSDGQRDRLFPERVAECWILEQGRERLAS